MTTPRLTAEREREIREFVASVLHRKQDGEPISQRAQISIDLLAEIDALREERHARIPLLRECYSVVQAFSRELPGSQALADQLMRRIQSELEGILKAELDTPHS